MSHYEVFACDSPNSATSVSTQVGSHESPAAGFEGDDVAAAVAA